MKKLFLSAFAIVLLLSNVNAQEWEEKRKSKTRENSNSNNDEIIIKRKAGRDARVVIEIRDDEVLVNGKPLEDYDNDDVVVLRRKGTGTSTYSLVTPKSPFRAQGGTLDKNDNWNKNNDLFFSTEGAFLGVSTEDDDDGARITAITKGSAAEKAGLEKGDVIKRVNESKIENPADLTNTIRRMRPDDKVRITFERDGEEETVSAKLGRRNNPGLGKLDNLDHPDLYGHVQPHFELEIPKIDFNYDNFGQTFVFPGKGRLGIRAQDTDDGDGVKVLDVDPGSAADKAGLRKGDLILEFDGEDVDSAEELAEIVQDRKDKSSVRIRINRQGRTETLQLNVQKKMKTSNL